jgi:hypothetical protein
VKKIKHKPKSPEQKLKKDAMQMAKRHLQTAIEWIDRNDPTWALVMANSAVKLIEVARLVWN